MDRMQIIPRLSAGDAGSGLLKRAGNVTGGGCLMGSLIDTNLWLGLIALTCALYMLKWFQGRRKVKVYRISPASLKRSKDVMLRVLPLVEDGRDCPLDAASLPCDKTTIKSAVKILAYHFWKEKQHEELARIKLCFISLARFQNRDLDSDACERLLTHERERLLREFDCYLAHTPARKG